MRRTRLYYYVQAGALQAREFSPAQGARLCSAMKMCYPVPIMLERKWRAVLRLVRLEKKDRPLLNEMMDEWTQAGEKIVPYAIRKCDYHDFERYLDSLEISTADERHVPDSTFFLLDEEHNRFLGAVNIRHWLNDDLLRTGGHIGDGIRPSARGRGYGTQMIALALQECRKLGLTRVLMCCDRDNRASARTIEKNGGVLENEVPEDGQWVQRYWIDLGE